MRAGLVVSVLVVLGISYGLTMAWRHSVREARALVEEALLYSGTPGTEVARFHQRFDAAGARRLLIENRHGGVEVTAGGPAVEVERIVYALSDEPEARRRAAHCRVSSALDAGGRLRLDVRSGNLRPLLRVDLVVSAPAGLPLELRVRHGRAAVAGWHESVTITSRSGEVALQNIAGHVNVTADSGSCVASGLHGGAVIESGSGSVEIRDVQGPLRAAAGSGAVTVERVAGGITLKSTSGEVRGARVRGAALAESASGAVTLSDVKGARAAAHSVSGAVVLEEVQSDKVEGRSTSGSVAFISSRPYTGRAALQAVSGSITISLPSPTGCQFETSSGSGPIRSDFNGSETRGGGLVTARTVSGAITIGRR